MPTPKITIKKYMGDDQYSWAVFKDGKPIMTGLNRRSAQYYRDKEKEEKHRKRC